MRHLLVFGSLLLACLLAQPRFNGSAQTETLVSVCAANYSRDSIALDSIVAAFGSQLTTTTLVATDADPNAPGIQLPTSLGAISVRVAGKLAPLFFVSPSQINYLVPPGLQIEALDNGFATVEVVNGNSVVASGRAQLRRVAPAAFSFDGSGTGLPAALIVRVKPDLSQIIEPLTEFLGGTGRLKINLPDVSRADERVFLVLYLSGVRNAPDSNRDDNVNESIHVLLNDYEVEPYYVGAQRVLAGLDQINVQIPAAFLGQTELRVTAKQVAAGQVKEMGVLPLAVPAVTDVRWTTSGLDGQRVNSLAANNSVLLAGTATGILRSTDRGTTWAQTSFTNSAQPNVITLYNAGGGSVFYSGTADQGPCSSLDNGQNWRFEAERPINFGIAGRAVYAFASFNAIVAGVDNGLYRLYIEPQRGWTHTSFPNDNSPVTALAKNYTRSFAGTQGRGIFSGDLNGANWIASATGLPNNARIRALTASAHYLCAAVADQGLYRSEDNGVTWARALNGLPENAQVTALASFGRNIVAGTQGSGVFLSTDFGLNWQAINMGLGDLNVLSLLVADTRLYAGTQNGVYVVNDFVPPSKLPVARAQLVTTDEDTSKTIALTSANPLVGNLTYAISSAPQNGTLGGTPPNVTYTPRADFNGTDLFTFTVGDGRLNSLPARVEITIPPVNDPPRLEIRGKTDVLTGELGAVEIIATDVENGTVKITPGSLPINTLFTPGTSARAPNYFSWLSNTPGVYQLSLTATDDDPQPSSVTQTVTLNIVASPEQNAWSTVTLPPFRFLLSFFADPSGVYLGLDMGTGTVQSTILRSTDNGASWTPYNNGLPSVNAPQRFVAGGNALYVGTQNGVWRSSNVNANWTEITNTLVAASKQVWELAASGDKVAVATPAGCYLSPNRGESWNRIRDCLRVAFSGNTLFVEAVKREGGIGSTTTVEGLFLSNDNGATWNDTTGVLQQFKYITRLQGDATALCVFSNDLAGYGRLSCSGDQGRSWKSFSLGTLRNTSYSTFNNETFTSIAAGGNALFVGTNPYGVFVSRDAGATWLPANSGLQLPLNVRELWVRGDYLFAASVRFNPPYGGNVFVRRLANN
jgi:uncharacterized protein (TIGR03437 family)